MIDMDAIQALTGAEKFNAIVQAELAEHQIAWCQGGCAEGDSHTRGFVIEGERTVHFATKCATRNTLFDMLHEIGHVLRDVKGQRRWESEQGANEFAIERMREYGISIPRKTLKQARAYVARMKRWGDNIAKGRTQS